MPGFSTCNASFKRTSSVGIEIGAEAKRGRTSSLISTLSRMARMDSAAVQTRRNYLLVYGEGEQQKTGAIPFHFKLTMVAI